VAALSRRCASLRISPVNWDVEAVQKAPRIDSQSIKARR
jgi:hypothetical protein